MSDAVENLILDLIEWLAREDRSYQETLDAWRTSCPRLTVWEDAMECGLVMSAAVEGRTLVRPTLTGLSLLQERRRERYDQLHGGTAIVSDSAFVRPAT